MSALLVIGLASDINAQCETWNGSPKMEEAENAHSNYRSAMKIKDMALAFDQWKVAYDIAPAADGMRDFHYMDGIKLFKDKLKAATDDAQKAEYKDAIVQLYDQAAACYASQSIKLKGCADQACYDAKVNQLMGRKGFDMFYDLNSSYEANLVPLEQSISGNNEVEYIVFEPLANIVVHQFKNGKMEAEKARQIYARLDEIAEWNIENNDQYGEYYKSTQARFRAKYAEIESDIFDCEYFKGKLKPKYEEKPDDPDIVKYTYNKLLQEGCDKEDPFMKQLEGVYQAYAAEENARMQAEFEANNPGVVANNLYKQGDFEGAIAKYQEALANEEDANKRAQYHFSIAVIQGRKMGKLQDARTSARKAAELRPNWGNPYLLIGDMYAQSAKSCGKDAFGQRIVILAAMDKYRYAKSIDPEVAEEVDGKLSRYNGSLPTQDDAFMRGHKPGDKMSTGCWVGETTTLRVIKG
ncbi:MAG: tetratricopeptide repeat protein [Saprospiraceae bacterium]|nr:tetratricopeptide repeat protein [Saprospiraceae bacterium]